MRRRIRTISRRSDKRKRRKKRPAKTRIQKIKFKDAPVVEQKKSGLTLTIKRKPSFLKESSSSDDDDSSSVESFKVKKGFHPSQCNDTHDVKKKTRRDSRARSRSDSEEREGNKKRKRLSSAAKSSSRSRKRRRSSSSDSSSEQIGGDSIESLFLSRFLCSLTTNLVIRAGFR